MIKAHLKIKPENFSIIYFASFILAISLSGCYSSELKVSEFEFNYNNENYIIRSAYCPNNPESCNQLMGADFIAVDMNQDRIIDDILKGDITLSEAQEIYDYSLDILSKQGKINEINRESKKYLIEGDDYDLEIISFFPRSKSPFNEFKVFEQRNQIFNIREYIFVDNNADGKLDEFLKGSMKIEEAQKHYSILIKKGLENNNLIKMDQFIVVK
jgi:hypothetical protein